MHINMHSCGRPGGWFISADSMRSMEAHAHQHNSPYSTRPGPSCMQDAISRKASRKFFQHVQLQSQRHPKASLDHLPIN